MAIYNASLLISASNATYFTNVTGGIAAVAVRDFNDTWISSSALLTGSNTFVGNQIISGNVDINGAFSASLQTGYLFVGDGNGRTQAVATSSIITNIETGSFATTGSNTFIGNQIISGNVLPQVDGQGDLGTDTYKWNKIVVNGELKGSSLNTTGRGAVGTLRVSDETFPLSFLADREIVGDGSGANTHMYYGTSSSDVTALREFVYTQSGSNADFGNVSASFNTRIDNLSGITGSFATTGSNVFKGTQFLYSTDGVAPLQISSSAYYGINLENQGILISGNGGPRIQFPNATWLNGNENDNFQFTGDTDNPLTRGLDFFLYGSGSRTMRFRNNSGPGGTIQFETSQSAITFNAGNNIGITAGNQLSLTGSQTLINGIQYPQTDGTNGQALITNGSGILSFGTVSTGSAIDTGSFITTGSVTNSQTIFGNLTVSRSAGSGQNAIDAEGNAYVTDTLKVGALRISGSGLTGAMNMLYPTTLWQSSGDITFNNFLNTPSSSYTGSISFNAVSGNVNLSATGGGFVQLNSIKYPETDGTNGQVITTNGSGVLTFTTPSGGATGSFATLGANTFTGSQTISASNGALTFSQTGSSAGGIQFPNSKIYQNNFLNFEANDVGVEFSVAGTTPSTNINFRNTSPSGQIQFTSDSSSISLTSATTTTISSSTTNIYSPNSGGGGINNRGVVTIGQNIGTGFGESYLLGYSGSLVIGNSVNSPTYAALSHITSSQPNGNNGLIFKTNNNTGTTLLNGSANIFTNPNTPTTDYIRYVGGSNNLYLNNSNGVNSQITASATSVSGNRPTMNNNIFQGTANFAINQAVNGGTHTYNNNLFGATNAMNINALAFTGSNFTINDNIFKGGGVTINPASASLAEIAAGVSGSANVEVVRNISLGTGGMTINIGPQSKTGFNSIFGNVLQAGLTVTNISSSAQVIASNNNTNQPQTYTNAGARDLGIHRQLGQMSNNYGGMNLIASASAINALANISTQAMVVTNRMYSGSLGSGSLNYSRNLNAGTGHTYTATGSFGGTGTVYGMIGNATIGGSNTIFTNVEGRGNYVGFLSNVIGGQNLILTGSNNSDITASGGAYFGRFNADDGIRNQSAENIFFVGTGTSTSNRKTGFLIDSGSNTFVEGSLNVSGSTALTGSLAVSSFTTLASVSSSLDFADDTAAAAGGVPLGGLYRNGNFVMIRLT